MAHAPEAPATSTTAEGPTPHTQNQAARPTRRLGELSRAQIDYLLRGIDGNRVGQDGKGFSHVEAWDIRRHLIRIFGFGGHDTDLLETTQIAETSIPNYQKTGRDGKPYGKPYEAWTVIYRVAVRLAVKVDGVELGHWHGIATGDAPNQPSRADAHDLALKTADSQALKRAATNLGDQFGLSLYNKGRLDPVVQGSLAYIKPRSEEQKFKDGKVEPEPDVAAARQEQAGGAGKVETAAETAEEKENPAASPDREAELAPFLERMRNGWTGLTATLQSLAEAHAKGYLNDVIPYDNDFVRIEDILNTRIAQLKAAQSGAAERSAA